MVQIYLSLDDKIAAKNEWKREISIIFWNIFGRINFGGNYQNSFRFKWTGRRFSAGKTIVIRSFVVLFHKIQLLDKNI